VTGLVLAAAAGIRSGTDEARRFLCIVGLVQPGRRIARHRRRFARSAVGRTLAFVHWGAADPVALDPEIAEAFLAGPGLHSDTWTAWQALVVEDLRGELDRLDVPVLVLWGADDNQLPLDDGFEYARRLRAPLRTIPDCGHLLVGERPEACADAIEAFLAERAL
jgi:pimeloyl-ACP methyl ester carboxylesterase